MKYLINLSYNGSKYYGYQIQKNKDTVEGELEKVLSKIFNRSINTIGASRTDRGVHAINQYCTFEVDESINTKKLLHSVNSLLSDYIHVKSIKKVNEEFNVRHDVKRKEYIYKINMGEYNPLEKDYVYQYNKRLDLVEMERALKYLEGEHDFKSFSKADDEKEDYVRTIIQTNIIREIKDVNHFTISFLGTGFLRYQVRNMVGLLIEIGEGKRKSEDILEILEAKDRRKAGITAPGEGLYLKDVFYY